MKNKLPSLTILVMSVVFSSWATDGFSDLATLVKSKVSDDIVLTFINVSSVGYALTANEIIQLKDMGASSQVIVAAIQHKKPVAAAKTDVPRVAPSGNANDDVDYQSVPAPVDGILPDSYGYWQYPDDVVIDLGWQPYYHYHRGRWHDHGYSYRHGYVGQSYRSGNAPRSVQRPLEKSVQH